MICPDFSVNISRVRWDGWRAFHVNHGPFTQFDTGELVLRSQTWNPDDRRSFRDLGVTIVASEDETLPALILPDGTPIKRAWLYDGGAQVLLIDDSTRHVVRIGPWLKGENSLLPTRFAGRAIEAYFAGPGRPPIGTAVSVSPPYKLSKDEKDYLASLRAAAKMWWNFGDDPAITPELKRGLYWDKTAASTDLLLGKCFAELKDAAPRTLALLQKNGYQVHRVKTMYDYLLVA